MTHNMKIKLVHLYADEMNIYGDNGNVQIVSQQLIWLGYEVEVLRIGIGDSIPKDCSMIFGGGGQDSNQSKIIKDLEAKKLILCELASNGVPMLMICGMYQLFGKYFLTSEGEKLPGIGYFDAYTVASSNRLIGNIIVDSDYGTLIGYENHSGLTYLNVDSSKPLGRCQKGFGNNGEDCTEGIIKNNVIGTYMHGPVLSKSPGLLQFFVEKIIYLAGNKSNKNIIHKPYYLNEAIEYAKKLNR